METRTILVLSLIVSSLFVAENAFAQTGAEIASRHEFLDQAMTARDAGDHTRALDLAERALHIRLTASVRYFIAEEQAALSLATDALASAEQCVQEVGREPPSRNRAAVEGNCRRLVEQLHQRVGFVVVLVTNAPENAVVQINGHPLSRNFIGAPFVVNAGRAIIDVAAEGYDSLHNEVLVPPTRTVNVEMHLSPHFSSPHISEVVALTEVPRIIATPPETHPAIPPVIARHPPLIVPRTRTVRSSVGLVVGSLGLTGLIAGAITGLYANSLYGDFYANCVSVAQCPDRNTLPGNIRLMDTIANVSLIGGGTLLATGAVLYLVIHHTEPLPPLAPRIALDPMGRSIGLGWHF